MSKAESLKAARVNALMNDMGWRFVYFKGANLMSGPSTRGFIPFDYRIFGRLCQEQNNGISENMIRDFAKTVQTLAPDWSDRDRYIAFHDKVWDMRDLKFTDDQMEYVYSSPTIPSNNTEPFRTFLLQLAKGDEALARDYLQALAPLFMERKPAGVIWFVGNGANGKSALINAIYRLMGNRHLSSLTTAAIEDGKAAPVLNGVLGNIVRESSESRVEDTERYKAIGTHEPFAIRQLYTQENITVETNFHTIFNANNVPVFADKTKGARRRTLVLPFNAHFKDNPRFEDDTFTPEFLGGMLTAILEETVRIRDNNYRYKWSDATLQAKEQYDNEVNSAEAFVEHLRELKVVGFFNYMRLKQDYDNWCSENGLIPLGMTTLRRTVGNETGAVRKTVQGSDGRYANRYFFIEVADDELVWLSNGYGIRKPSDALVHEKKTQTQISLGKEW